MILERLEITGFGCLHDITTDLHPRVTVVAGGNESGKSTLLRAVRGALYGIDAGGQGRAVDRSDWARYEPWSRGGYGLALTYKLDDGRRIRVARRLDTREQSVQVLELGGSELTDELRSGRAVTPGRFHLGIDEPVFCATYADGLADLDLPRLLAFHAEHGALATMTVARPALQFGVALLDGDGRVRGFREKPRTEHWINAGFFCFGAGALSYLERDSVLERAPLERLAAEGELRAHRHEGFWECMDTYKDAVLLNDLWSSGRAPWRIWP